MAAWRLRSACAGDSSGSREVWSTSSRSGEGDEVRVRLRGGCDARIGSFKTQSRSRRSQRLHSGSSSSRSHLSFRMAQAIHDALRFLLTMPWTDDVCRTRTSLREGRGAGQLHARRRDERGRTSDAPPHELLATG